MKVFFGCLLLLLLYHFFFGYSFPPYLRYEFEFSQIYSNQCGEVEFLPVGPPRNKSPQQESNRLRQNQLSHYYIIRTTYYTINDLDYYYYYYYYLTFLHFKNISIEPKKIIKFQLL